MSEADKMQRIGVDRMSNIEETKKNIDYWENEVQEALKEGNIMKAVGCKLLANNLRMNIGEKEI